MQDTVKIALLVAGAILLFALFFQAPPTTTKRQVTFEVPPADTGVQTFISPSGAASADFLPNDGEKVYADYA